MFSKQYFGRKNNGKERKDGLIFSIKELEQRDLLGIVVTLS